MPDVPDEADDLFGLPVGQFVSARDALVATSTSSGDAALAAALKKLRRPTLSAWAVNHVVRAEPEQYQALVAAGTAMQKAQRRALSGVRDTGLRDASTTRRRLVDALTDRAAQALADAGARPDGHLEDVATTFEAASADPDAAATVGLARLSAPVRVATDFSGTSALLAMSGSSTGAASRAASGATDGASETDEDRARAERRRAAIKAAESAHRRAASSAVSARAATTDAQDLVARAEEAERIAVDARAAADGAADRAEAAQRAATEATAAAEADARAAEDAQVTLDDLR